MNRKYEIPDIVNYIIDKYPKEKVKDLSKARLNKLIYLIDWKSAIDNQKQISNIKWYYNFYGPYVDEIENILKKDNRFKFIKEKTYFGNTKTLIKKVKNENFNELDEESKKIIDFVIDATKDLKWNKFINLVYLTYPVKNGIQHSYLNLVKCAEEYTKE